MIIPVLFLFGGFALLYMGGETVLKGAIGTAQRFRMSPLLIGLTVISMGTSMPELVVSLNAGVKGSVGLALGNVIGSNIANVLLILGLCAIITTLPCDRRVMNRDALVALLSAVVFAGVTHFSSFYWATGMAFLTGLAAYIIYAYHKERKHARESIYAEEAEQMVQQERSLLLNLLYLIGGLVVVIIGAELFVDGAVKIARALEVPETIIGLTLVAVGTSLPELATVIPAVRKGHPEVVLGNIIGSNIFNLLGIVGITSLFVELPIPDSLRTFDIPVMVGVTALLAGLGLYHKSLSPKIGMLFIALYVTYIYALFA